LLCLLFLLGLFVCLKRHSQADRLILLWCFIPFFLLSMGLATSVRYALVFMPAVFVTGALAVPLLGKGVRRLPGLRKVPATILVAVLVILLAVANGIHSRELRALRCTYDAPAGFLRGHGSRHISLQHPVGQAYLGVENVKEFPYSLEVLEEAFQAGYRYVLIDYRKYFIKSPFDKTGRGALIDMIENNLSPVFTYEHPCYSAPCYLFELNVFFKLTLKIVAEVHEKGMDQIRIYDLGPLFEQETRSDPAVP